MKTVWKNGAPDGKLFEAEFKAKEITVNKNVRKILGSMSAAGLIVAGSLPLMGSMTAAQPNCSTRAKAKKNESVKTDKSKAQAKVKAEKGTPEKANKAKNSK